MRTSEPRPKAKYVGFAIGALLTASLALGGNSAGQDILAALDLPIQAQSLRNGGMDDNEVSAALAAARAKGLSARETRDMMLAANAMLKVQGGMDNFGGFVTDMLASGKRGKALSAAIRGGKGKKGKGKKGKGKKGKKGGRR